MGKYNPYTAINTIYNLKGEWDKANAAGDATKKKEVAQSAQYFYDLLKNNGYADVADTLSKSNYSQAKYINDFFKPRETTTAIKEENEKLFDNYSREYEDLKKTNPFETEEGKAILAKYDLAGLQGRDNQVAAGGATNGGNIDSYAAANALRQQAALVNQGQQTVLGAYQQKLDHARSLLADMGVNISRVHADNETTKQNDFAIEREKAVISGYTPASWMQGTINPNPYLNADGTLKSEYLTEEFDNTGGFSTIIANAEKAGNAQAVQFAKEARAKKLFGNYAKYAQWDDGNYAFATPQRTSEHELTEKQIGSAEKIALDSNATTKTVADINAKNNLDQINAQTESQKEIIDAQTQGQKEVIAESAKYGVKPDGTALVVEEPTNNPSGKLSWDEVIGSFDSEKEEDTVSFMNKFIKPMFNSTTISGEDELERVIVKNSYDYKISKATAAAICSLLGLSDNWLDNYVEDKTWTGKVKGLKLKDGVSENTTFEPTEEQSEAPTEESAS